MYIENLNRNVVGGILEQMEKCDVEQILNNNLERKTISVQHEVNVITVGWNPLPGLIYEDEYSVLDSGTVLLTNSKLIYPEIIDGEE